MNTTYLISGSNKGDKLKNLHQAKQFIEEEIGTIVAISDIYVTAAWGNTSQPDFVNQALCVHTSLSPMQLLQRSLTIEKKMGRIRGQQKWMQRVIDIDILFYNDIILDSPDLKIPHPYLQQRKFVLIPLSAIAPEFIHPVFNKNIETLLRECSDTLEVEKIGDKRPL